MNKTAQTFLGLAIAIIFPVFVLYAAVTFVPSTDSASELVYLQRALIGIGFGLLGLLSVLAVLKIPSLVYGIASGAGLTLLGAITTLLSTGGDTYHSLIASILIALFMILVGMAMLYERRFGEVTGPILDTGSGMTSPSSTQAPTTDLIHPAPTESSEADDSPHQ